MKKLRLDIFDSYQNITLKVPILRSHKNVKAILKALFASHPLLAAFIIGANDFVWGRNNCQDKDLWLQPQIQVYVHQTSPFQKSWEGWFSCTARYLPPMLTEGVYTFSAGFIPQFHSFIIAGWHYQSSIRRESKIRVIAIKKCPQIKGVQGQLDLASCQGMWQIHLTLQEVHLASVRLKIPSL